MPHRQRQAQALPKQSACGPVVLLGTAPCHAAASGPDCEHSRQERLRGSWLAVARATLRRQGGGKRSTAARLRMPGHAGPPALRKTRDAAAAAAAAAATAAAAGAAAAGVNVGGCWLLVVGLWAVGCCCCGCGCGRCCWCWCCCCCRGGRRRSLQQLRVEQQDEDVDSRQSQSEAACG